MNAFVLAFTSEFIPKLLYRVKYSSESSSGGTLTGYINNSLSSIHTTDIFRKEPGTEPEDPFAQLPYNDSVCKYFKNIFENLFEVLLFYLFQF